MWGATCSGNLPLNTRVRKLCQQQSRPESLGPPRPSGALRIDPELFPEAARTPEGLAGPSWHPAPAGVGAGRLSSLPHPPAPPHLPGPPATNLTILMATPFLGLMVSHCHSLVHDVLSTWTVFILLGPATASRKCSQVAPPGRGLLSAPCRPHFEGPKQELHLSSWSSGWAFTRSCSPSSILQLRKLRLVRVE